MLLVWTGVWRLRLPLRRIILQQGWIKPKISQSKNIVFKVLFYLISKGIVDQYFFKWANPGPSFIYFRLFNTVNIIFCRRLDSNCRPLESEATALPTEPQPLPSFPQNLGIGTQWT